MPKRQYYPSTDNWLVCSFISGCLQFATTINSETFVQAAIFWAEVRNQGKPTSDNKSLDCDAILAAQALQQFESYDKVTVITTNVKHIERFAANNELEVLDWVTTLNNFVDK